MDQRIITQLKIIRMSETKPNFAALGRRYDVDWRTVKKYYDGYEGKPIHRNKTSKLDKYLQLTTDKLAIKGTYTALLVNLFISETMKVVNYFASEVVN